MKAIIENSILRRLVVIDFESLEEVDGNTVLKHSRVLHTYQGSLASLKVDQTVGERLVEKINEDWLR